jgi:hypothetical protein
MYRYSVSGLIPRYWEACRTFITSRDSLTRNATLSVNALLAERRRTLTPSQNSPQMQPVVPLCHPAHPTVKPFSPAVVLRMPGILGNSPGIVGTSPYILWLRAKTTTISCAFSGMLSLSHSTVIVCLHPLRSFLFFVFQANNFSLRAFTGLFLARSTHSLRRLTRSFETFSFTGS